MKNINYDVLVFHEFEEHESHGHKTASPEDSEKRESEEDKEKMTEPTGMSFRCGSVE